MTYDGSDFQIPELHPRKLPVLGDCPLVSVLIPNYNYERFVGQALDSLLAQTYPYWEAIICDDGSTDGSRQIITDYAARDRRIRYIFQGNRGVAAALNACFEAVHGEIICFLDADDLFHPNKIRRVVDALQARASAGMCIHPIQRFDETGRIGGPEPVEIADGWIAPAALTNGGTDPRLPPSSGLSFRAPILKVAFPLPTELRRALDFYIIGVCVMITEVIGIPDVLTMYRVHGTNISAGVELDGGFLDRNIGDQGKALRARCNHLRSVLGSWPEMQLEDNRAARNGVLYHYLIEGTVPPSFPVRPWSLIKKESNWKVRAAWRVALLLPRCVGKKLLPRLRAGNAFRKKMRAPKARRARFAQKLGNLNR